MRELQVAAARPCTVHRYRALLPRLTLTDSEAYDLVDESWESLVGRLPPRRTNAVTYSRKVFIPLTRLCQDSCGYCTFAKHGGVPNGANAYLTPDEVLDIAREGAAAGCTEALFTLGDRPELRWPAARSHLSELGFETTIDYLADLCSRVLDETGLLPHTNPGVLNAREMAALRKVSVSQGLMLESTSSALLQRGAAHFGCKTKQPRLRLATMERAGRLRVPFTTGVLLGIGEARRDVIDALLQIRRSHARWGHIQEVIVQPFRAKQGTALSNSPDLPQSELLWAVCAAKMLLTAVPSAGGAASDVPVQSPPNLSAEPHALTALLRCGVDDWGGVSPGVTADHVNPEAAWPTIAKLRARTEAEGLQLLPRLPVYPAYVAHSTVQSRPLDVWQDAAVSAHVRRLSDASGLARSELPSRVSWFAGVARPPPSEEAEAEARWLPFGSGYDAMDDWRSASLSPDVREALVAAVEEQRPLSLREMEALLRSRGTDCAAVCRAADELRQRRSGAGVSYAVVRNINYTNKCSYACSFCAFSKGKRAEELRGKPYELDSIEVGRRTAEAWDRGATEVCMQGGIHPNYDGHSYLRFLQAAQTAAPGVHVHAFSPLEVWHGASSLGVPIEEYLQTLQAAGLGSLPGTAAEVLSDPVRHEICPDKLGTRQWLEVICAAHAVGLSTTSTLMCGHTEGVGAWARHLMRLRVAQLRSLRRGSPGRITEFVPLPFVHTEAPVFLRGGARAGPTLREAVLVHAVGRLALAGVIDNVQVSWTKMGPRGAAMALLAGANDLGGTLMNEHISRAAGAQHGQEMNPEGMRALAAGLPADSLSGAARWTWHRTTLYQRATAERTEAADNAPELRPI